MRILGVNPGAVSGGCAIVEIGDGVTPQLVDTIDLSIIGAKAKQRIDVLALRTWIQQHRPDHAVIERAQAMPKQGASSGFKYGRAVGMTLVRATPKFPLTGNRPGVPVKQETQSCVIK